MKEINKTNCALCGRDLEKVFLYKNKIYGSECVKKVAGKTAKQLGIKSQNTYKIIKTVSDPNSRRVELLIVTTEDEHNAYCTWINGYRDVDNYDNIHYVSGNLYVTSEKFKKGAMWVKQTVIKKMMQQGE